jgi:hypothetical protein
MTPGELAASGRMAASGRPTTAQRPRPHRRAGASGVPTAAPFPRKPEHGPRHLGCRGRRRQRGPIPALERVEYQCHEPPRRIRGVLPGYCHYRGVGDQQQQDVLADEILTQPASGLGALNELDHPVVSEPAKLLDTLIAGQRHGQQVGQATVGRLQLTDPLDETGEAGPRVRDGQRTLRCLGVLGEVADERCGDKLSAVREAAVQRGDADPGAQGDFLQGRFETLLGEHLPGGIQQRDPVSLGIHPQPTMNPAGTRGVSRASRIGNVAWASLASGGSEASPARRSGLASRAALASRADVASPLGRTSRISRAGRDGHRTIVDDMEASLRKLL